MRRARSEAIREIRGELVRLEQLRRMVLPLVHEVRMHLSAVQARLTFATAKDSALALKAELGIGQHDGGSKRLEAITASIDEALGEIDEAQASVDEILKQSRAPVPEPIDAAIQERVERLCGALTRRPIRQVLRGLLNRA
jgi:hypothetical protein